MRLSEVLRFNALRLPDKVAFRAGEDTLTYRDLERRARRLAGYLARTLGGGERVAVVLPNCLVYPEIYFACAQAETTIVPISHHAMEGDLDRVFAECTPSLIITEAGQAAKVAAVASRRKESLKVICYDNPLAPHQGRKGIPDDWIDYAPIVEGDPPGEWTDRSSPDDAAIILFTSGTTGRPKGVLHSQQNFMHGAMSVVVSVGLTKDGRALQVLPMGGINFVWVLSFCMAGMETVILPRFDATGVAHALADERITHTVLAPIMMDLITRDPAAFEGRDYSHLEMLGYGGSRTPKEVTDRAIGIFGPVLRQMYGQTEASGLFCSKAPEDHEADRITAGYPLIGVSLRIVSPEGVDVSATGHIGEIQARVNFALLGYWGQERRAGEEVWLRTGDTGLLTPEGRLVVMGRVDDMIVTGGTNVYPREIEDVLMKHPDAVEVAVVGLPDPVWGEKVAAFFVAGRDGATETLRSDLELYCRRELVSAKRPRAWFFVDRLPRNQTGKILKAELIRHAQEQGGH